MMANSLPAALWHWLETGRRSAAENMAWDEVLLMRAGEVGPLLRFYGWTEPAATFGYFQKFDDVVTMTSLRPLIRRPTAGGLVPHDADWTYSLVLPPGHAWYELKARESYERAHAWVQAAFQAMGCLTELSTGLPKDLPGRCFIGAEPLDVVCAGRKVAGAAQRRTRQGLLIQGSIQPPPGLARSEFERVCREEAGLRWGATWRPFAPSEAFLSDVERLRAEKYSRATYNEKR